MTAHPPTIVHPTAVVGPGVELGVGVSVGPHAVLLGPLQVGDGAWIGAGTSIGAPPEISTLRQNLAWDGDLDHSGVVIEEGALIRELVVIHQGSRRTTIVGARSLLFNRSYLAHDVQLGAGVTISAGVSIAGHATIQAGANLGMNVTVHQRRVVGALAMIGMGAAVTHDIPPFAKAFGVPVRLRGVNDVGMSRAGICAQTIAVVAEAYAAGRLDLTASDVPDVSDEFAWWAAVPDRRPVPVEFSG
ncbi:MAG: acyl-ACP--UDP-N- acetylglucosamine O-acyltransferase [Candidatus Phosphoribacter sp.]|nr:acyl-ACP--UDP-N- acetylglucosamine O-acyltransferase [Actinomycetales bacterium]